MKSDKMILLGGAVVGLGVLLAAVFADDFGDDSEFDSPGRLIAEAVGAGAGVGTPGLNAPQLPRDRFDAPRMQPVAIPGLVPFSAAQTERFSGRITQITALGSDIGWGQIHVTVTDDTTGQSRLVSLAPVWYLLHLGCGVAQNDPVTGIAFRFDTAGPDVPLYARTLSLKGRLCQLRSDEGIALWSNRLGQRP